VNEPEFAKQLRIPFRIYVDIRRMIDPETGEAATLLRAADKKCTRCGTWKPLDGFHRNWATRDGRQTVCKVCRNADSANRRAQRKNHAQTILATEARRHWRTGEESLLSAHYETKGPTWCAVRLNRTPNSVRWHWMAMRRRDKQ
jgi:hypothetical protein